MQSAENIYPHTLKVSEKYAAFTFPLMALKKICAKDKVCNANIVMKLTSQQSVFWDI